jgi:hypothetical protein
LRVDGHLDVLLANEPNVYRDVLACVLPLLRPLCRFRLIDPADVDDILTAICPALVITSRLSEAIQRSARSAIVLYPGGRDEAIVAVAGEERVVLHPHLSDLLAVLDAAIAAEAIARSPVCGRSSDA